MRRDMPDASASFPCLEDFDLYAGDGHAIAAASHDVAKPRGMTPPPADSNAPSASTTRAAVTKYATGHLYTLDLRTHAMSHLTVADPGTGIVYHYITNLPVSVAPGVVALLYKVRWDVEKVFDEFKNKLVETKAWASSANAKAVQARMLCLTHNLMTLMEQTIERRGGVRNEAEFKRRDKRKAAINTPLPSVRIAVQRLTQRTVKFIRWLKNHLDLQRDWDDAIARLSQIYSRL
jgi:hypothetical protein